MAPPGPSMLARPTARPINIAGAPSSRCASHRPPRYRQWSTSDGKAGNRKAGKPERRRSAQSALFRVRQSDSANPRPPIRVHQSDSTRLLRRITHGADPAVGLNASSSCRRGPHAKSANIDNRDPDSVASTWLTKLPVTSYQLPTPRPAPVSDKRHSPYKGQTDLVRPRNRNGVAQLVAQVAEGRRTKKKKKIQMTGIFGRLVDPPRINPIIHPLNHTLHAHIPSVAKSHSVSGSVTEPIYLTFPTSNLM
ncbi:hypothetical protein B0H17DRAFT_1125618 [Mycena rosella]|uniref:Uncharacterized protein n=1 Tax=Mycena rosella TaxID=1033263 RepID=A0AAD7M9D5_MYCRO|nr:hypothetical protein B0H17DRAFT_1125618 [Mycena rosella]